MAAWECKLLRDRACAALERGADGIEALDDPADLRRRAAIGGQPRGFDLDAGAQLHHVEDRAQRRQRIDVDAQRPARIFRDEGADALPRDHEAIRAQGRHGFRPAHIHFLIGAPGYRELVTALYLRSDDHIDSDTVFGVTESLVTDITPDDPKSPFPDLPSIQFDFQLAAARAEDAPGRVGADPSEIVKNA